MARYRFDQIAINSTDKRKPEDKDQADYIGLEHLDSGSLKVTRWGSKVPLKGEKLVMKKGDVLFGKRNAYLRRAAISPHDGLFSAHGMVLRPKTEIVDPEFFPFFIGSDYFFDRAIKISVGSLSPTVNWRDLKKEEFDLPSIPEQKKLTKVLRAISITKYAYEDLVRQTDELVKSQFIEMFGPIDQEGHWKRVPWKKVLNIINGKDYKKVPCDKGTYPVYGTGGEMARVDEYLCPENSVLVGRKGTIDHPLLVKEKFWNVDTAFGLVPNENLNYEYLYWFCLQFDFWSINKGTTLPSTTKADLEKIEINVPPVEC